MDFEPDGKISDIFVVGYPKEIFPDCEDKKGVPANNKMYEGKGRCMQFNDGFILYKLPTSEGQSGCPTLYKKDNMYRVIGVHIGGDDD